MFIQKVADNINETNIWYMIGIIAISAVLVKILLLHFEGKRKRILAKKIPGPTRAYLVALRFLLLLVMQGSEKAIENFRNVYRMHEKSLFKLWIFNELYIVLTTPEDIKFVLNNPKLQRKANLYKCFHESIMDQGIFLTDDIEEWKKNRKIISTFGMNNTILKSFIPIFYEETKVLSELLRKYRSNSNECNIMGPISRAIMDMIGRTALGLSFNTQQDGHHRFVENIKAIINIWNYKILHPWYLNETLYRFSSIKRKHDEYQNTINEIIGKLINKTLFELSRKTDDRDTGRQSKSILEILLGHYPEMSLHKIQEEIITIFVGAQDSTITIIACVIFVLAHHQEIQNKVFEELHSIFSVMGDYTRRPTYKDLQEMVYLERVIKETLRVFTPSLVIGRKLEEEIKIGKYLCPAGSQLAIFPRFVNLSPLYYTDPNTFNPDNFLPDECNSRNKYTYLTFSAGPRNCLGIKYTMIQMKTILSTLIRTNKFLPSERCPTMKHLRFMFLLTLKIVGGCYVKIEPRT